MIAVVRASMPTRCTSCLRRKMMKLAMPIPGVDLYCGADVRSNFEHEASILNRYPCPYHEAAVRCVPGTKPKLLGTVPRKFVSGMIHNPATKILNPPPEIAHFRYAMTWHPRLNTDAAHS